VHEALWPNFVHAERRGDADLERIVAAMGRETGPEVFVRQQRAIMGRRDSRPLLPALEVPALVLVGEGDLLTPPEQAREMAGLLRRATLVVVPDCGHLSTLEQPEAVNRALAAWLAA
jgi:pimeloyl-ACP methyl ester carboxylesterase